jgi:hypothetical protein
VEAHEGGISALDDEVKALLMRVSVVLWEKAQTNGYYARADDTFCVDDAVSQVLPPIEDVSLNEAELVPALCDVKDFIVASLPREVQPDLLEITMGSVGPHRALLRAFLHILPCEQHRQWPDQHRLWQHPRSRLRSTTANAGSRSCEHGHSSQKHCEQQNAVDHQCAHSHVHAEATVCIAALARHRVLANFFWLTCNGLRHGVQCT